MTSNAAVTPNKRGARSRQVVLDAAERVIAVQGYAAASLASIVEEAGIPMSSMYHYFGSKEGVLLAVMERGAERFYAGLPEIEQGSGTPEERLTTVVETLVAALEQNSDFLRLIIVMEVQPPLDTAAEVQLVVRRMRDEALRRLQEQVALAFDISPRSAAAKRLGQFALAAIDGAFVATQGDRRVTFGHLLRYLPAALVAMRDAIDAKL
jgi:AcrR family transcriptional regulator